MSQLVKAAKRGVRRALVRLRDRLAGAPVRFDMPTALARAAARAPGIRTIIDVGASDGSWSELALPLWPGARTLLIEANPVHAAALERLCAREPRATRVLAVASDHEGKTWFDGRDPLGGRGSATPDPGCVELVSTTIDACVARLGLEGPFLIKLDTHGHEGPILAGAARTLLDTHLAVIEAYNFEVAPGCMLFHELCAHLATLGLRPIDLCDPLLRPGDAALWQMDLVFLRADHPTFRSVTYDAGRA